MHKARGRNTRRHEATAAIATRLSRLCATTLVAATATTALIAVVYLDLPRSGAATPVPDRGPQSFPMQLSEFIGPGPCTDAADTVPPGADATTGHGGSASNGCAGSTDAAPDVHPATNLADRLPSCAGDGTSGNRIAFYYAYLAGRPDRLDRVRPALVHLIEQTDDLVHQGSRSYGSDESLRILTDRDCVPLVGSVQLPATAADSFDAMVDAFGRSAPDRKYVVFVDTRHFCGLATLDFDDSPGPANANNRGPSWARIDLGCWTPEVTAHEIFHMLGAVQRSAPHYDGTGHCTDGSDLMCYPHDGEAMQIRCPGPAAGDRLDCGGDDYYNPDPAPGSYLSSHWNTANSSFLYGGGAPAPAASTASLPS